VRGGDTNAYTERHANAGDAHAHTHGYCDAYSERDGHAYTNSDSYGDADFAYTYTEGDSKASAHAAS
jgi:hypothetical protein